MKKFVLGKIVLLTLGLVIAFGIVVFALLSVAFPGLMASWCEQTGNYSLAVNYAALYYQYTGGIEEAARCAQDSILSKKYVNIIDYGVIFIDHEEFDNYCDSRDEYYKQTYDVDYSYRQYIYGEISVAYYSQGYMEKAIGCAIEALDENYDRKNYSAEGQADYTIEGFADNNALITLSLKVISNYDEAAAGYIAAVLDNIIAEGSEADNLAEFKQIINVIAESA